MARPIRIERPGAWFHVTARGKGPRAIYRGNRDRLHFCQLLGEAVRVFRWKLHAYVLMENHFHLLVETPEPNLGQGMHWLNLSYSVWFKRRHGRAGHLFRGRYKAIIVDPTLWALELSRHIHLNPVRVGPQGLGATARRPNRAGVGGKPTLARLKARTAALRRYPWSSYQAYLNMAKAPEWLTRERILELAAGRKGQNARRAYRQYVESAIRQGLAASPWEQLTAQSVLGGAKFVRQMGKTQKEGRGAQFRRRELWGRRKIAEIIAVVAKVKAEPWKTFRDRYGDWGRDMALYLGRKGWGIQLKELGDAAGGMDFMSVSAAVKRLAQRAEKDSALAAALNRCRKELKMRNV